MQSVEFNAVFRLYSTAMLHNLNKHSPDKKECRLSSYPHDMSDRRFWENSICPALKTSSIREYCAFVWLCLALDNSSNQQEYIKLFAMLRVEITSVGGGQSVDA